MTTEQEKWIIRVRDMINIGEHDTRFAQAIVNGGKRQFIGGKRDGPLAMLDMRKTFLLGSRDDITISDKTRRRVVIRRVDSQCVHRCFLCKTTGSVYCFCIQTRFTELLM